MQTHTKRIALDAKTGIIMQYTRLTNTTKRIKIRVKRHTQGDARNLLEIKSRSTLIIITDNYCTSHYSV